jgi:hypothetical protein
MLSFSICDLRLSNIQYGGRRMKSEYDLSKGVRGKFYRKDAKVRVPIYLNDEAQSFVEEIARKKTKDVSAVVNELILHDKSLIEAVCTPEEMVDDTE